MTSGGSVDGPARAFVALTYLGLWLLLVASLKLFIAPIYGYSGFAWSPSLARLAEAGVVVTVLGCYLPTGIRRPSDLFVHVQFLFPVLPVLALYGGSGESRAFAWGVVGAFALVLWLPTWFHPHAVRFGRMPPRHLMTALLAGASLVVAAIVLLGGLSHWNTDLFRVYEFRGETWRNLPRVFGYLVPFASKVMIPSALLLALLYGYRAVAVLAIVLAFVLFGLTSHKDILVYPVAVMVIYAMVGSRRPLKVLLGGYAALVLLGMVSLTLAGGSDLIGNLGLRRSILLPAQITYWYHDFFSDNTFMLWSQSKVSFGLIEPRYPLPGSIMVGLSNFGSETSNVTTGWIGSGYMNGGIGGLLFYAVLVGMLLAYLDSVARHVDPRAVIAIAVPPVMTVFLSSDLPTAFFNHGVLVMLLLFACVEIGRRPVRSRVVVRRRSMRRGVA